MEADTLSFFLSLFLSFCLPVSALAGTHVRPYTYIHSYVYEYVCV
jgi:hypothetical protein